MNGEKMGILVAGGPAPGINSAIHACAAKARNNGLQVVGFIEGFEHILSGSIKRHALTDMELDGIHLVGGSIIQQSRANLLDFNGVPDMGKISRAVSVFDREGISRLVTIGGDDTAFSAHLVARHSGGRIRVVHVPKTIDNDLPLPEGMPTFGFATAVEVATREVVNLMQDAHATNRWYIVVIMGRTAGHLALHTMVASGASVVLIPEEFREEYISFARAADVLYGRISAFRTFRKITHGVAIVSEGIGYKIRREDFNFLPGAKIAFDEAGHLRMSEVPLAHLFRRKLEELETSVPGKRIAFIENNIGYEIRSAPPVASDIMYTQLLGNGAVGYLLQDENIPGGAMITIRGGKPVPISLSSLLGDSGKIAVRVVDTSSYLFKTARMRMEVK